MWRSKNILQKNKWVKEKKKKRQNKNTLERNKNGNKIYKNLGNETKAALGSSML